MNIGIKIKKLLKQYGWTQPILAGKTGLSQPFISAICRDEKQPSLDNVLLICNAFSITPNDLLLENGDNDNGNISDEENVLLRKYRLLSNRDRGTIMGIIDLLGKPEKGELFASQNGSTKNNSSNPA